MASASGDDVSPKPPKLRPNRRSVAVSVAWGAWRRKQEREARRALMAERACALDPREPGGEPFRPRLDAGSSAAEIAANFQASAPGKAAAKRANKEKRNDVSGGGDISRQQMPPPPPLLRAFLEGVPVRAALEGIPEASALVRSTAAPLSEELGSMGWISKWSTTKQRWYYFNTRTNTTQWDPPRDNAVSE